MAQFEIMGAPARNYWRGLRAGARDEINYSTWS